MFIAHFKKYGVIFFSTILFSCILVSTALCQEETPGSSAPFLRGDVTNDGRLSLNDAGVSLRMLFTSLPLPDCLDVADVNDDGVYDMYDPIHLLSFLFHQGPPVPWPNQDPHYDFTNTDPFQCGDIPEDTAEWLLDLYRAWLAWLQQHPDGEDPFPADEEQLDDESGNGIWDEIYVTGTLYDIYFAGLLIQSLSEVQMAMIWDDVLRGSFTAIRELKLHAGDALNLVALEALIEEFLFLHDRGYGEGDLFVLFNIPAAIAPIISSAINLAPGASADDLGMEVRDKFREFLNKLSSNRAGFHKIVDNKIQYDCECYEGYNLYYTLFFLGLPVDFEHHSSTRAEASLLGRHIANIMTATTTCCKKWLYAYNPAMSATVRENSAFAADQIRKLLERLSTTNLAEGASEGDPNENPVAKIGFHIQGFSAGAVIATDMLEDDKMLCELHTPERTWCGVSMPDTIDIEYDLVTIDGPFNAFNDVPVYDQMAAFFCGVLGACLPNINSYVGPLGASILGESYGGDEPPECLCAFNSFSRKDAEFPFNSPVGDPNLSNWQDQICDVPVPAGYDHFSMPAVVEDKYYPLVDPAKCECLFNACE